MRQGSPERQGSPLLPKELGERLLLLRTRVGLSQEAVATMLGLNSATGKAQVSKMETGRYRSGPGFTRLLDFLRACGSGIGPVLDVLDRYTSRVTRREEETAAAVRAAIVNLPKTAQRRALYYDIGLRRKARVAVRNAVGAEQRVRQALARARAEAWEKRLHRVFNDELNRMGLGWSSVPAVNLRTYGKLVFGTLRRLRGARPAWRAKALARLDAWPELYGQPSAPYRRFKAAVMELFEKLERAGKLD